MPTESQITAADDSVLSGVRRRGLTYLGYVLWVFMLLGLLLTANAAASLAERYVALLEALRRVAGLRPPATGPDLWILAGLAVGLALAACALIFLYRQYRRAWTRRLRMVWTGKIGRQTRVRPLEAIADDAEVAARTAYLRELAGSPAWQGLTLAPHDDAREYYRGAAAQVLRSVEADIAHRAVTAGLVIGLNRNPLIDSLSIVAAALELQFHVLTRLGKRPSPRVWMEMLRRTSASLFLNSYVSREDALYLNLAIRKAAWGMTAASDAAQHAAQSLADVDWHDVLGDHSIPGLSAATSLASMTVGVGAFGLRQLGNFVDATASDLLQGVLAGGVLYYHGMALAADCLALDQQHREGPEMTRTLSQAMGVACAPAGRILREQVRRMRELLSEKRRMALTAAKQAARQGAGSVLEKVKSAAQKTGAAVSGAFTGEGA